MRKRSARACGCPHAAAKRRAALAKRRAGTLHGLAAKLGLTKADFNPRNLAIGRRVEMEHTDDWRVAEKIAMDHLAEDSAYYQKLAKMEKRR